MSMRRIVYKALVSLPAKLISSGATILGLFGTFASESARKVLGDRMTAENIQHVGVILLVAALVYVLLLWRLKPEEGEGGVGTTQSLESHGPYSPVIMGDGAIVNFHGQSHGSKDFEPPTLGPKAKRDQFARYVHGLERALAPPAGWNRDLSKPYKPRSPNMHLREVLIRVYKYLGGAPERRQAKERFYERVDNHIMDMVSQNNLNVWVRSGKRPLQLLEKHDWDNGSFDHRRQVFTGAATYGNSPPEYTDIQFNREEIDAIWRP